MKFLKIVIMRAGPVVRVLLRMTYKNIVFLFFLGGGHGHLTAKIFRYLKLDLTGLILF